MEVIDELIAQLREKQPEYLAEHDDERFGAWMYLVDRRLVRRIGFTSSDLEDWTYRDAFDGGMSPAEAAEEALEYAGMVLDGAAE
jgi:hypothetical protein